MPRTKKRLRPPTPALVARMADVLRRLLTMYDPPTRAGRPTRVLDVLVEATLSQNTSMPNATRGYRALRRAFPTWRAVAEANVDDVRRQIQICGLARMRAFRLQAMLQRIRAERGTYSLESLRRESPGQASDYLTSFHGVGPKTTAFVSLFSLDHPTLPVDNGILRVLRRLKLIATTTRDVDAVRRLSPAIAAGAHFVTHVLLFRHAKERCRPRNPKCIDCRLLDVCPYGKRRVAHLPVSAFLEVGLTAKQRERLLARFISAGLDHKPSTK